MLRPWSASFTTKKKRGSDILTVNEQLVSVEAPAAMTLGVVAVLIVRHISEWRTERATNHMDGVRACDTSRGRHTQKSQRSRTAQTCQFVAECGM